MPKKAKPIKNDNPKKLQYPSEPPQKKTPGQAPVLTDDNRVVFSEEINPHDG